MRNFFAFMFLWIVILPFSFTSGMDNYPPAFKGDLPDGDIETLTQTLGDAMLQEDIPKTYAICQERILPKLGEQAGIAESIYPWDYQPTDPEWPSEKQIIEYFKTGMEKLTQLTINRKYNLWEYQPVPLSLQTTCPVLTLVRDQVALSEMVMDLLEAKNLPNPTILLNWTQLMINASIWMEETGQFLLSIQQSNGLFPFPDIRGSKIHPELHAIIDSAEERTPLEYINITGYGGRWIITDIDGGMQFDHGLAGVYLCRLYQFTKNQTYLNAAISAGFWALHHTCAPNFNYNCFSIRLLNKLYEITGNFTWLDIALHKLKLGVFPGIIHPGTFEDMRDGRFMDPHNAKPTYHAIILETIFEIAGSLNNLREVSPYDKDASIVDYYLSAMVDSMVYQTNNYGVVGISNLGIFARLILKNSTITPQNTAFAREIEIAADNYPPSFGLLIRVFTSFNLTSLPIDPTLGTNTTVWPILQYGVVSMVVILGCASFITLMRKKKPRDTGD